MAAAFIAENGHGIARTAANTLTFTTTRDIQTGERVVCAATVRSNGSPPVTGVTVGTLALALDIQKTATEYASVWSAVNTGGTIATGTTVTVTVSGVNIGAKWACCFSLSGVDTTTPVRTTTSAGAVSTNPDPGATDASPQAGDVAIGVACTTGTVLPTAGAGYTVIIRQAESTNGSTHDSEYQNLTANGSTDANWTLTSTTWAAVCVVYAQAAGTTPVSNAVPLPVEALGGVSADGVSPLEALGGIEADLPAPLEALAGIAADSAFPLEALGAVSQGGVFPIEALGNTPVSAAALLPIEALAGISALDPLPLESLAVVAASAPLPLESILALLASGLLPLEAVRGIAQQVAFPLEALAIAVAAAGLPIEALGFVPAHGHEVPTSTPLTRSAIGAGGLARVLAGISGRPLVRADAAAVKRQT